MIYIVHNSNYERNDHLSTFIRQHYGKVSDIRPEDESVPGSGLTAAAWVSGQTIMTLCDMYDGQCFSDNDAIIFVWENDYGIKVANDLNTEHKVEPHILYCRNNNFYDSGVEYNLVDLAKYA